MLSMQLLTPAEHEFQEPAEPSTSSAPETGRSRSGRALSVSNEADVRTLDLAGVARIDLHFPKFTDGRAYSQAVMLRRRQGFAGDIRATGDVLPDQLLLMQRSGFSSAVLKPGVAPAQAALQLHYFDDHYQGDALQAQPRFSRVAADPALGNESPSLAERQHSRGEELA